MIPQTRTDLFLAKITGEDVALPVPQTRFELYLANIAGESYELPAPNSRATLYLAKILGQDVELPEPQTRSELYLASIAGMSVELPEAPQTREEWYLAKWAEDAGYVVITGNPVSFNAVAAALRQLKIAFSPVQDLHGYANPWPAGGGANKWDEEWEVGLIDAGNGNDTPNNNYSRSKSFTPLTMGESYYFCPVSKRLYLRFYDADKRYLGYKELAVDSNRIFTVGTTYYTVMAQGDIAFVRFCWDGNTYSNDIAINYPATVTTYSPYENECPISGWTGVNVWDDPYYAGLIEWNQRIVNGDFSEFSPWGTTGGAVATVSGNIATVSLTTAVNAGISQKVYLYKNHKYFRTADIKSSANITLTISGVSPVTIAGSGEWERITDFVPWTPNDGDWYFNVVRRTESEAAEEMQVRNVFLCDLTQMFGAGNEPATVEEFRAMFPKDYYAYNAGTETTVGAVNGDPGWLVPVSFPDGETYYSGWVDPTKGTGAIDKAAHVFTGNETWVYIGGDNALFYTVASSIANPDRREAMAENGIVFVPVAGVLRVYLSANPTLTAESNLNEIMTNGIKVVYGLDTPVEIQLTPQQINSLAGTNNMWSDANGPLTVEYWKDGNVSDAEALSLLLGGRYSPAQGPEDVPDREALRIITGR